MDASEAIKTECDALCEMLLEKNKSYGNSVFDPINIFSKNDWREQIGVRIDDKLNRLKKGEAFEQEDTIKDLIGYLIILRAGERLHEKPVRHSVTIDTTTMRAVEDSYPTRREYDPKVDSERPDDGQYVEVIYSNEPGKWRRYEYSVDSVLYHMNLSEGVTKWRYKEDE